MYLITALCLLCACVSPLACRSTDARDTDTEPYVAHHHHDGNIAELLIPLLERSLKQEPTAERANRRKSGKKVIQVRPYRGSEEHKRKGWRKLNSHKKQVVEITPLHGKNRAKPLAYILSAAKHSHGEDVERNDDVSSLSTSDLEHDKSSSEEQQSSEEEHQVSDRGRDRNALRTGADASDTTSASILQSRENVSSKESKDASTSDKESSEVSAGAQDDSVSALNPEVSADVTRENIYEPNSDDKSASYVIMNPESIETEDKRAVTEEIEEDSIALLHSVEDKNNENIADRNILEVTVEDEEFTKESPVEFIKENFTDEENEALVETDIQKEEPPILNLNLQANRRSEVSEESDDSPKHSREEFLANDIVISRGHHDVESAEKSFSKLFNARARDIIELIQSSVEATTPLGDCLSDNTERHSHDHKSYRLSFLFNK